MSRERAYPLLTGWLGLSLLLAPLPPLLRLTLEPFPTALPWPLAAASLGAEVLLQSLLLLPLWLPFALRPGERRERLGVVSGLLLALLLLPFLLHLLSGWLALHLFKVFPGIEGYVLFGATPRHFLQHVALMLPAAAAAGAGLLAGLAALVAAAAWVLAHPALHRPLHRAGTVLLLLCALLAALPLHLPVGEGGESATRFFFRLGRESGPFATLVADLWERYGPPPAVEAGTPPLPAERPPRRSAAELAAGLPPPEPRYNVLVLLIESLRPDPLQSFGGPRPVMPALDRLAAGSLRFHTAFSLSSHSNYADLVPLTSQYPMRSRHQYLYPPRPPYPRLPLYDLLHQWGYRTAVISSQNEHWGGMLDFLDTGALDYLFHAQSYAGELEGLHHEAQLLRPGLRAGKVEDRITVERLMEWIEAGGERPFFAYTNLQTSHFPYELPPDGRHLFFDDRRGLSHREYVEGATSAAELRDLYADALHHIDLQLGRLFDFLERSGRLERTVVVVSGDTATSLLEDGRFLGNGGDLLNSVLHVPLIVHLPGRPGGDDFSVVSHLDVAPTVAAALGWPEISAFQGQSLLDPPCRRDRPLFAVAQTPVSHQYAVIHHGWKLVYDYPSGRFSLFDLRRDPLERHDLGEERPDLKAGLAALLIGWKRAQLAYYGSEARMASELPPRYRFESDCSETPPPVTPP